jgi:hypothetical protein
MLKDSLNLMRKRTGYYGAVKRVDGNGQEVSEGPGKYKRITYRRDQWTRMREDKLRSLMHALHYSYQAAVCQPLVGEYTADVDKDIKNLTAIYTRLDLAQQLDDPELGNLIPICEDLEERYPALGIVVAGVPENRYTVAYRKAIKDTIDQFSGAYFRCLINHDKLKVDYEDKIISIPFEENTVDIDPAVKDNVDWVETNFHNGTVFKWVHGNKEEWVPDTYWIVLTQYSDETAYFRGEIRRADEEIEIIVINDDGSEEVHTYRGWMTGPNEETLMWNVKKGIVWNDMNYTKKLYITKDPLTLDYFQRFDRVIINGQPWEVQAYNDNYGSSASNVETGILRVALKETYTSTNQQIREMNATDTAAEARIIGSDVLSPYDERDYVVENAGTAEWVVTIDDDNIIDWSVDNNVLHIIVKTTKAYRKGFQIAYGDLVKHITIKSL